MKAGDLVMVKQFDHGFPRANPDGKPPSEDAQPMVMWIYAIVLEALDGGAAFVEITHPANIEHGVRKTVPRKDLRTLEDIQALHDAHPDSKAEKLDFNKLEHKELNNFRAAIERMKPAEAAE